MLVLLPPLLLLPPLPPEDWLPGSMALYESGSMWLVPSRAAELALARPSAEAVL